MRILLLGAHGMLGKQLLPVLEADGHEVTPSDRVDCDLLEPAALKELVAKCRPELFVNCAAYTNVDKAESEPAVALDVNTIAARNVAQAVKSASSRLIHISTDYVYGGSPLRRPLVETDPEVPRGVYGYSKYLGDEFIRSILPGSAMILRSSWLHGQHGPNFVHTILKAAKERPELRVVDDQIGSPTWAGWLSRAIAAAAKRFEAGTFHAANKGEISWYEFAAAICKLSGSTAKVLPQSSAELSRPAPRPPYSALDCSKLEKLLGEPCQGWEEGLKEHLKIILH